MFGVLRFVVTSEHASAARQEIRSGPRGQGCEQGCGRERPPDPPVLKEIHDATEPE
jgi:hypothetical protein